MANLVKSTAAPGGIHTGFPEPIIWINRSSNKGFLSVAGTSVVPIGSRNYYSYTKGDARDLYNLLRPHFEPKRQSDSVEQLLAATEGQLEESLKEVETLKRDLNHANEVAKSRQRDVETLKKKLKRADMQVEQTRREEKESERVMEKTLKHVNYLEQAVEEIRDVLSEHGIGFAPADMMADVIKEALDKARPKQEEKGDVPQIVIKGKRSRRFQVAVSFEGDTYEWYDDVRTPWFGTANYKHRVLLDRLSKAAERLTEAAAFERELART